MEILGALIRKADNWSLWLPLGVRAIPHRASLYADDLILFISLSHQDLQLTRSLLSLFERASELGCNFAKCQMAPIRCQEEHLALAALEFPCQIVPFISHQAAEGGVPVSGGPSGRQTPNMEGLVDAT
jgi:hypothetical protein